LARKDVGAPCDLRHTRRVPEILSV